MMNRIDKYDAPEGFVAVLVEDKGYQCETCYFGSVEIKECPGAGELANVEEVSCDSFGRADGCEVYFTKKENMNETEADDELEFFDGHEWRTLDKKLTRKKIKHGIWARNYINDCVIVRSINTRLVVVDLEEEKAAIDDTLNCYGYSPLNEWTFYEVDLT